MTDPLEKSILTQAEYFKDIVGTIREPLLVLDACLRVLGANRSFYKFFKVKAGETIGRLVYDLGNRQWNIPGLRLLLETILPQKAVFNDYNVEHDFPVIGRRILLLNARRISRLPNKAAWILLAFEDVTERMELERKLQASEKQFHAAFETSSDCMLLVDKISGQVCNSNRAAQDSLGYSIRAIQKKNLWELGILKDKGQFRQTSLDLEEWGVVDLLDKTIPTRRGGNFPADVYLMDRAAVIQCTIRDISARKQSEGAIHDLARFPTENPNPVMRIDRGGILLYANEAALVQLADWKLEPGNQVTQVLNDPIQEVFKTGTTNTVELTCEDRIFSIAIGPTPEGNDVNIYGVDITEGKQTEQALKDSEEMQRSILVSTPDGITVLDLTGIIKFCNQSTADIHGYSSTDQLIGKSFLDLIAEEDHPRALEGMQRVLLQGIIRDLPFTGLKHNGEEFAGELSVGLTRNSSGQPNGFVGNTKDITGRRRADQVLLENEQRLSSIYDTVGDVIYFLSVEPDEQYRFSSVNPAFMKVTGLPAGQVIGRKVNEVIPEPSLSMVLGKYRKAIRKKGIVRWEETSDYPSGRLVGDVCIAPVFDEAGNCTHLVGSVHDITERKKTEQALRESEDKYHSIFENIQDIYYETSFEGIVLEVSPSIELTSKGQYHREDLIGRSMYAFYAGTKNRDSLIAALQKTGSVTDFEVALRNRDNSLIPCSISAKIQFNAQGNPEKIIGSMHDITARKQAEEKLGTSENELRALFAAMTDVVFVLDADGRYLEIAPTNPVNLYRPAQDMLGKTVYEVLPKEPAGIVLANIGQAIQTKQTVLGEYSLPMDGKEIWFATSTSRLSENSVIFVAHDITARKRAEEALRESEQKFRTLIDNSVAGIYIIQDAKMAYVNPSFAKAFGYSPEEINGRLSPKDLIHPEDIQALMKRLQERLEGTIEKTNIAYKGIKKDGSFIFIEVYGMSINYQGRPAVMGTLMDITERKHAEEKVKEYSEHLEEMVAERTRELRQAHEELVRKEKLAVLGTLAGSVGHELRNPLGVISNSVYYLKLVQPEANEKIRKHLAMIEQELHNATHIVSDLLDYARVINTDPKPGSVTELVEHTLSRFPVPASIHVSLDIPADLSQVYADPLHVQQILGNLVTNACQAMANPSLDTKAGSATMSGRCKLTISAHLQKKMVAMAVKDTGTGIIPENLPKLFEPLFSTKVTGIGLGLAVSKKLAEANGGRIEVKSQVGKGSTFTLYLPVLSSDMGN